MIFIKLAFNTLVIASAYAGAAWGISFLPMYLQVPAVLTVLAVTAMPIWLAVRDSKNSLCPLIFGLIAFVIFYFESTKHLYWHMIMIAMSMLIGVGMLKFSRLGEYFEHVSLVEVLRSIFSLKTNAEQLTIICKIEL